MPKRVNPPNESQARPIENFYVNLAQKIYNSVGQAKDEIQLMDKIKKWSKKFTLSDLQVHMIVVLRIN